MAKNVAVANIISPDPFEKLAIVIFFFSFCMLGEATGCDTSPVAQKKFILLLTD